MWGGRNCKRLWEEATIVLSETTDLRGLRFRSIENELLPLLCYIIHGFRGVRLSVMYCQKLYDQSILSADWLVMKTKFYISRLVVGWVKSSRQELFTGMTL